MNQELLHNLYDEAYKVWNAWETYGGSFKRGLAQALKHADFGNMLKIKNTFIEEWNSALQLAENL